MMNAVMLDIAIVAVLALFMFLGWKRGLFRSLAELAVMVIALALAYQAAGFAAGAIVERSLRPAAHKAIDSQVERMMEENLLPASRREEMERVLDAIPNGYLREKALELLESLSLSTAEQAGWSARDALTETGYAVVDETLDTAVYGAVHGLVCAVVFTALLLALHLAVRALDLTFKLPVLHQLNGAGGLLFGAGKGLALVCLGIWVLSKIGLLSQQALEGSALVSLAARLTGA